LSSSLRPSLREKPTSYIDYFKIGGVFIGLAFEATPFFLDMQRFMYKLYH